MSEEISPLTLKKLLEEHHLCQDPVYFYQKYVLGRPATPRSKELIREAQRVDRLLEAWKKAGRI